MVRRIWKVGELLATLNVVLEDQFGLIWVEGEVTNFHRSGRGHLYFSLKDEGGILDCAMWVSRAAKVKFELEDGLAVVALGRLAIYPQRGRLQLLVDELEPKGLGALQLAFEQLKAKLSAEGLFAPERKRPLPLLPQRVGIVTSLHGAALRDMLKILRRHPHVRVVVAPASVQGEGAAEELASALDRLGASGLVDVIIVGRGGGSLEDLWAFNEEVLARAVARCPVPVISGVGHQVDFTICDFVADIRAATPTHAAQIVVEALESVERAIEEAAQRLGVQLRSKLRLASEVLARLEGSSGLSGFPARLELLSSRVGRARERLRELLAARVAEARSRLANAEVSLSSMPRRLLGDANQRLVGAAVRALARVMLNRIDSSSRQIKELERALRILSPQAVLERGYSITTLASDGRAIRDPDEVPKGAVVLTRVAKGCFESVRLGGGRRNVRKGPEVFQPLLLEMEE